MPDKRTIEKARRDKRRGKSASTQAGEFVADEIEKIRHGAHGAKSTKQAIAIGLSEARTRKSAEYAYEAGQGERKTHRRPRVSRAVKNVLKREPRKAASRASLSKQAKSAAQHRSAKSRSAAAKKAARTRARHRR